MRYTLLDMTTEGQDLKLSPAKFETGRNFANKVWNAGRFLLMNLAERPLAAPPAAAALRALPLGFAERWILDRLQSAIADAQDALARWRFNDYAGGAYRFFRDDLCDWYVEWAKTHFKAGGARAGMAAQVLAYCMDAVLRLLHPGMPFLTEHLWQHLQGVTGGAPWMAGRFLMLGAWPEPDGSLRTAGAGEARGELDGARIIAPKTLALMTSNFLPDGQDLASVSRSLFSESTSAGSGFGLFANSIFATATNEALAIGPLPTASTACCRSSASRKARPSSTPGSTRRWSGRRRRSRRATSTPARTC